MTSAEECSSGTRSTSGSGGSEDESDEFKYEFGYVVKTVMEKSQSQTQQSKQQQEGEQVWETNEDWLDRMGKILGVYAEIIAINKDTPFSLDDGWTWLTNIVNTGCSLTYTHKPLPFYMAETLDIFLRIAAVEMNRIYGKHFHKILVMIKKVMTPRLQHNGNRKIKNSMERLNNFLDAALNSKKPEFLTMVSKS